jgi:hypothetical protein
MLENSMSNMPCPDKKTARGKTPGPEGLQKLPLFLQRQGKESSLNAFDSHGNTHAATHAECGKAFSGI